MLPRKVLRPSIVFICLLFLMIDHPISAQTLDFRDGQPRLALLDGLWRFQAGDNPVWADPVFDDSHWSLLNVDQSWAEQGYNGYDGLGWYRIRIQLPPKRRSLAPYFPRVVDSCEVFANGHLIGRIGGMPPTPKIVTMTRTVLPIPDNDLVPGRPLLLAVQVWKWQVKAAQGGGGIYPAQRIGEVPAITEWSRSQESQVHSRSRPNAEAHFTTGRQLPDAWCFGRCTGCDESP